MILDFVLLFVAGIIGGILNSIAGGGSFVTFPALVFVGVPPLIANATNTFASCGGYLSGVYAFKDKLKNRPQELFLIIICSLVGGGGGAYLLLNTSESVFQQAVPWLLLFATLLFIFGAQANALLKSYAEKNRYATRFRLLFLSITLLAICIYGGFFNAGLGIIVLSYLTLCGHSDMNVMNAIKLVVSSTVSLIAIFLFVLSDSIAWVEGTFVLVGTLLGGYFSAHISMRVSQQYTRRLVIIMSIIITLYFFYIT
ncbi:UPF0721 transmembrane protein [Psychromonas marina]|uniref:Probable membrane transporter protein n=1 Tax=Psychromonas marina TaxID=88364 RepID=A0ABQ6E3S4_9GAMM|nr:sulfite exporter TauE/SafE family protein [Psychromonas marina]GLS92073.1 UPF0721 transmembrane protein [Psychromonas marina]